MGLSAALLVAVLLEIGLLCRPFEYNWNKYIPGTCGNTTQAYEAVGTQLIYRPNNYYLTYACTVETTASCSQKGRFDLHVWGRNPVLLSLYYATLFSSDHSWLIKFSGLVS